MNFFSLLQGGFELLLWFVCLWFVSVDYFYCTQTYFVDPSISPAIFSFLPQQMFKKTTHKLSIRLVPLSRFEELPYGLLS